jgi:hypothetical protein
MAEHDRHRQIRNRGGESRSLVEIDQELDMPSERRDAIGERAHALDRHRVAPLAPIHQVEPHAAHARLMQRLDLARRDGRLDHRHAAKSWT